MSDTFLFVYGSLREGTGHPLQEWLADNASKKGKAYFRGKLYDLGSFPGAVSSDNTEDKITGDLYRLQNPVQIFKKLDRYEGYQPNSPSKSHFIRKKAEVTTEDGEKVISFIYIYNHPITSKDLIESGNYLEENNQ